MMLSQFKHFNDPCNNPVFSTTEKGLLSADEVIAVVISQPHGVAESCLVAVSFVVLVAPTVSSTWPPDMCLRDPTQLNCFPMEKAQY